jgi:hypothetical protein
LRFRAPTSYIQRVSTVAEISDAIAKLTATEQLELLRSVSPHLKISAVDVLRNIDEKDASAQFSSSSARTMLGFAKQFHPNDTRTSDQILRELREGDAD